MIVSNTRDEMSLFLMMTKMPADEAAYAKQLRDDFGDLADAVATVYPEGQARDRAGKALSPSHKSGCRRSR
jgi:hypothetical protein